MKKYYESYKLLIIVAALAGIYLPSMEKISGGKWYMKLLKIMPVLMFSTMISAFVNFLLYVFFDESRLLDKICAIEYLLYGTASLSAGVSLSLNKVQFERIFQLWDSLFLEELYPDERKELLRKNRDFTVRWLARFGATAVFLCTLYPVTFYFNPDKEVPHPMGIPYRHAAPDFYILVTFEVFVHMFAAAVVTAFDSLTMALLSMEEAQFIHLKRSLARIVANFHVTHSGQILLQPNQHPNAANERLQTSDCLPPQHLTSPPILPPHSTTSDAPPDSSALQTAFHEAETNIRIWILHHIQILRFHYELQHLYLHSFSVKYFSFVLIVGLLAFLIVFGILDLKSSFAGVVFVFNLYASFYINITYADSTARTAASLFEDAFEHPWYIFPPHLKTTFLIILKRCRRPVRYKAFGIHPLSPKTFLKIFTSGYSYFTFLLQVNQNK